MPYLAIRVSLVTVAGLIYTSAQQGAEASDPDWVSFQHALGQPAWIGANAAHDKRHFEEVGCVNCHNGINLGGNSYQRLGVAVPVYDDQHQAGPDVMGVVNRTGRPADGHENLTVHYRYSEPLSAKETSEAHISTGFINAPLIESFLPSRQADYYFCGPKPFIVNIYHELLAWGIPGNQVYFEFFGPQQELARQVL